MLCCFQFSEFIIISSFPFNPGNFKRVSEFLNVRHLSFFDEFVLDQPLMAVGVLITKQFPKLTDKKAAKIAR